MFALSARFKPSRTPAGEGRIWYVIRQENRTRTIPSGLKSADKQIITKAKDRITFDLKSISCVIEEMCANRQHVSLDDVIERCTTVLNGENPYTELIKGYGSHFPIRHDITRVSKNFADSFEVVTPDTQSPGHKTLLTYIDFLIFEYKKSGRSCQNSYRSTLHSISRFIDGKDITLDAINDRFIQNYYSYLCSQVSPDTVSFYMRVLRTILNQARRDRLITTKYSWPSVINTSCNAPAKNPRLKSLSPEILRKIADIDLSADKPLAFARDMFMFCFYAQGLELIDLANLHITDLTAGTMSYRRRSKGRTISVRLGQNALAIISRYHESGSDYLFPLLIQGGRKYSFSHVRTTLSTAIKAIGQLITPPINLTFGMSRYSWIAISENCNLSESLI